MVQIKTIFSSEKSFPLLEFNDYKLLELKLNYLMLKLLINLVTSILECADMRVLNLVFLSVFYDCYNEEGRVLG